MMKKLFHLEMILLLFFFLLFFKLHVYFFEILTLVFTRFLWFWYQALTIFACIITRKRRGKVFCYDKYTYSMIERYTEDESYQATPRLKRSPCFPILMREICLYS